MMRRPLADAERPHLTILGQRLRDLRRAAGLTQADLAEAADIRADSLSRIERGVRRTRRSTLERIAPGLGAHGVVEELVWLAGPSLAPESRHAQRIARRRGRRRRRREIARERQRYALARAAMEREWAARAARRREFKAWVRLAARSTRTLLRLLAGSTTPRT